MPSKASTLIDELLQEAASFVAGSDYTGARERVRFARDELSRLAASHQASESEVNELGAHIDLTLERYDRLLAQWQRQNEMRRAHYLVRERAAIRMDDRRAAATTGGELGPKLHGRISTQLRHMFSHHW